MRNDTTVRLAELFTRAWGEGRRVGARQILLALFVGALLLAAFDRLLLGPGNFWVSFGTGVGMGLGAYVVAPLVALLGWPVRGEFAMRPLFCATLAAAALHFVATRLLLPLAFLPTFGFAFGIAVILISALGTFVGTGAMWMTLLPHRFAGRIAWFAVAVAVITTGQMYRNQILAGRPAMMQTVFEDAEPRVVRLLEPTRAPAAVLGEDFRAMEQDFRRPEWAR